MHLYKKGNIVLNVKDGSLRYWDYDIPGLSNEIMPVFLSSKWFEYLGFEERNKSFIKDNIIFYEQKNYYFSLSHDTKMKYVHELQNFLNE